ncbi:hypothetical protein ACIG47_06830 [Promicromonospora sp. NPDC052451]|uniref:hypothetical protein n=1 Tax=Promicromonospora sp. NPDC052451 TaxID=3364407 RepID=UPI0037CC6150
MAVVALLLAVVVVALGVALVVRPWEAAPRPPGGIEVDPARVAELEAAEARRNTENLAAAGELAVSAQERLLPVMDGLYEALPLDEGASSGVPGAADGAPGAADGVPGAADGVSPDAADLREWRAVVDDVQEDVEELPPGSSEHNIVRNGLLLSTGLLGDTLDVLEVAGAADAGGTGRLYDVAGALRSRAVDAWAQAAVQLDMQYIAADRGHLHAFLPLHSGMSTEGEPELGH